MNKEFSGTYFPALTGIRAVAAYMVFCHHFNPINTGVLSKIVDDFHIGVTIFFVLSGFLICNRYYDEVSFSKEKFIKYMQNRFARVYPMYFIFTTLAFLFGYISIDTGVKVLPDKWILYLLNISFLRGFFDDLKFTGAPQGWSLTVEECFYILAPFLFLLIRKRIAAMVYLPMLFVVVGLLLVFAFRKLEFFGFFGNVEFMFDHTFFGRSIEFFAGIGLGLFLKKYGNNYKSFLPFTYIGILYIIFCLIGMLLFRNGDKNGIDNPYGIMINNLILPFGICILFYGLISENTFIRKILETKLFILLGKSSYIFYLIQIGVVHVFVKTYITSSYSLVFIILNILSVGLFLFVEEPLNKWIRSFKI